MKASRQQHTNARSAQRHLTDIVALYLANYCLNH